MTELVRIMLVFVGAKLLLAIVCVQLQAASAPRKFVTGRAALNARVAPLWVAEDLGFFAKQGVPVNAILIRHAPVLVAALTAGDVHATGGTTVLTAVAGGADLKINGVERKPYPVIEGLRNIQRLMKIRNPARGGQDRRYDRRSDPAPVR
jgi:ABC-type nitrate/sulfonate/bicarbonate transport system substrate-binding protein